MIFYKRKLFIIFIFLFSVFSFFIILKDNKKTYAAEIDAEIKTQYMIGEIITIPTAELSIDDKSTQSNDYLVLFPSKKAVKNEEILLDEVGLYTVIYYGKIDNKKVTASKEFKVLDELYSVGNKSSSLYYGSHEQALETNGIVLKLAKDDTFTFNEVIDISNYTNLDSILKFFVTPTNIGSLDCQQIELKLTDAYDETNYIAMTLKNASYLGSWADIAVYVVGNANGQRASGIDANGNVRTDWSGLCDLFSICGVTSGGVPVDQIQFNFSVNYEKRELWCGGGMVIDLDDETVFTKTWEGFTTGECFLSIRGLKYNNTSLNMVITNIDNKKIDVNSLYPKNNPTLNVDLCGYDLDNIPNAKVGKKYPIFLSSSTSPYQNNVDVITNVYYNYGSESPILIDSKDGYFIPNKEGVYTICYLARDKYGYETKMEIDVLSIQEDSLEIDANLLSESVNIGEKSQLFSSISINNASGNAFSQIEVILNDDIKYILDENYEFFPEYSGEYKVLLKVNDYIEEVVKEYKLTVNKKDIINIPSDVPTPKYFIKNATYELNNLYAIDYSSGIPNKILCDIYVKEDSKEEIKLSSNLYQVSANSEVEIIYRAKNGSLNFDKTYSAIVIDTGYSKTLDIGKYFYTLNGNLEYEYDEDDNLLFNAINDSKFEFINAVDVTDLIINFNSFLGKTGFSSFNIYLTDILNGNVAKVSYLNEEGKSSICINENDIIPLQNFFGDSNGFRFFFSSSTGSVSGDGVKSITIKSFTNGKEYTGFTNNKAYVSFEFQNVSGMSSISIASINRQVMINSPKDLFAPIIYSKKLSGDRYYGEIVKIERSYALDVLDPLTKFKFTIKSPSGEFYKDENGILFDGTQDTSKDYLLKIGEYGSYVISFEAIDGANKKATYSFTIFVADTTPPRIDLSGIIENGSLNSVIKLATYNVEDDVSPSNLIKVYTYIMKDDLDLIEAINGEYKFSKVGTYKVVYIAFDEKGNMAYCDYEIVIK